LVESSVGDEKNGFMSEISEDEETRKEVEIFVLPNGGNNSGDEKGLWFTVKRENRETVMDEIKQLAIGMVMRSNVHTPKDIDIYNMYGRVVENPLQFRHNQQHFVVPKSDYFVWPGLF
jgi:hypothetical protein